jgi:xanthine dehydrogenase accessory factor
MLDILENVHGWLQQGQRVALATVAQTWGSAPRRVGSKMAVTNDLAMIGSVSGGCVENAVIEAAHQVLGDGRPRLLHFGVSDDTAWEVGLTCGGELSVFVEVLDPVWWTPAANAAANDQTFTLITLLDGPQAGAKLMLDAAGEIQVAHGALDAARIDLLRTAADDIRTTQVVTQGDYRLLIEVHEKRSHLILIGGAHVAMPLSRMAQIAGFRVSIVDPRAAFATTERFPDVDTILHRYPDEALARLGLDANTYVAVLTHDPKIDDEALLAALPSDAPYVGVLSSRRTHEKRVARLRAAGLSDSLLERICTPIGLDIQAKTPEEIAVSILAEIIAARNRVAQQ